MLYIQVRDNLSGIVEECVLINFLPHSHPNVLDNQAENLKRLRESIYDNNKLTATGFNMGKEVAIGNMEIVFMCKL